jgi:phosphatidylserine decarboxylase
VESFNSFNDFFIRKLKPEARPIAEGDLISILPADARYLFYQDLSQLDGFLVKGQRFCLKELLQDEALAGRYEGGSMVLARLCPTDYHRFHFPVDCIPGEPKLINGYLYSVNPIALKQNIDIFTMNKRVVTELETQHFGTIQFIEVGATNVGSINQTFTPHSPCYKGSEKGYFSFGASSLVLLFEPGCIVFDNDLIEATLHNIEMLGLMGQSMGLGME